MEGHVGQRSLNQRSRLLLQAAAIITTLALRAAILPALPQALLQFYQHCPSCCVSEHAAVQGAAT